MIYKIYLVLLLLCPLYNNICLAEAPIYSEQNIAYVEDLDLALKLSKDTKQQILLIFSASWCGYCDSLKNDLSQINNLDNKIICILDIDKNPELSKRFRIKTLPTSFILDSNGKSLIYIKGYNFTTYNNWLNNEKIK